MEDLEQYQYFVNMATMETNICQEKQNKKRNLEHMQLLNALALWINLAAPLHHDGPIIQQLLNASTLCINNLLKQVLDIVCEVFFFSEFHFFIFFFNRKGMELKKRRRDRGSLLQLEYWYAHKHATLLSLSLCILLVFFCYQVGYFLYDILFLINVGSSTFFKLQVQV